MDKFKSTPRLSYKVVSVILTQTDTTVGFLSQETKQLQTVKSRATTKPFIKVYKDFKSVETRVPNTHKNLVRRAKKTTFIVKNKSFRVARFSLNSSLLDKAWYYSTSANVAGESFDRIFCEEKADIIIEDKNSLKENRASALLKINEKTIRKLR
jgi:tRNA A37 threonylcarbamoyladenosine synthetase subunit TsaC/SUA5/YrdC